MKKRLTRLTESDLNRIVKKTVGKILREEANYDVVKHWNDVREKVGDEAIADMVPAFLGSSKLPTFIKHLEINWGLRDYTTDELDSIYDEVGEGEF